jgi:hypothetical protein
MSMLSGELTFGRFPSADGAALLNSRGTVPPNTRVLTPTSADILFLFSTSFFFVRTIAVIYNNENRQDSKLHLCLRRLAALSSEEVAAEEAAAAAAADT